MSKNLLLYGSKSPNCHSKFVKFVRAIVLDSNLIVSDLNDLGESIRSIRCPNRPIGTLFGPRNWAGRCASFAKCYRRFGVQMNKSTLKTMFWCQNKVPIGWFGNFMNLINTSKKNRGLRIWFQLSTSVLTKVTAFWLIVTLTILKLKLQLKMMSDKHYKKTEF
jgi:hypothetical protein